MLVPSAWTLPADAPASDVWTVVKSSSSSFPQLQNVWSPHTASWQIDGHIVMSWKLRSVAILGVSGALLLTKRASLANACDCKRTVVIAGFIQLNRVP